MLSLIKDIHQREDTDHAYVIFRTSPRAPRWWPCRRHFG